MSVPLNRRSFLMNTRDAAGSARRSAALLLTSVLLAAVGGRAFAGAPANARPPTAASNTEVSRSAALRRALPAASRVFMRNERRLSGTDISCLLHERGRWSLAHFHGQGKYDLCSTPTADYVTCSVDRGEENVTGVARTALLRSGTSELLREQRAPGRNTTTSPRTAKAPAIRRAPAWAIRRAHLTGRRVG